MGSGGQIDYAEREIDSFLVFCCQMSGFMQIYKTRNKSTEQALLKLREWGANFSPASHYRQWLSLQE